MNVNHVYASEVNLESQGVQKSEQQLKTDFVIVDTFYIQFNTNTKSLLRHL